MKLAALVAVFCVSLSSAAAARSQRQGSGRSRRPPRRPTRWPRRTHQFLLGHRLEEADDVERRDRGVQARDGARSDGGRHSRRARRACICGRTGSRTRWRRPSRRSRSRRPTARRTACSAPSTRRCRKARTASAPRAARRRRPPATRTSRRRSGISSTRSSARPARPIRTSARRSRALYVRSGAYDKAIPLLTDLVNQEPGWQDGPRLLAEAYAGAGRDHGGDRLARGAVARRSAAAADARRFLRARAALARGGGDLRARAAARAAQRRAEVALRLGAAERRRPRERRPRRATCSPRRSRRARPRPTRARSICCRRRSAASATSRRPKRRRAGSSRRTARARGASTRWPKRSRSGGSTRPSSTRSRPSSPSFAARRATRRSTSACCCRISASRTRSSGQYDKAIATFEEARKLSPDDPAVTGYLIQAHLAAKKYAAAADVAKAALAQHPDDLRLTRLEARALRLNGKIDQGIAILEEALKTHSDEPLAYISLAQVYSDANRGAQAVQGAAGRAGEVSGRERDRLRARRRLRQAEEVRRGRGRVQAGARRAIPRTPPRSTISATCWPSAASGSTSR